MNEKLSWFFEIIDRVSAPAKRMQSSLGHVHSVLNRMRSSGFVSGLRNMFSGLREGMRGAGEQMSSMLGGMRGLAAAAGVTALGGLALAGSKWAAESLAFRENSEIAFATILKSKQAGQRAMQNAVAFAAATPFETQDVIKDTQRLLVSGIAEADVNTVLAGAGDIGAAFGKEKQDQAIGAFQKIMAQGKLTGESIQMLGDAGIKVGEIYQQLGAQFGTTAKGAQDLISAGKIDANSAIVASLNTVKDTISGGTLGGMMAKQSKSLSGLWSTLTSRPFELLIAADSSGATDGIKNFLKLVTDALDPEGPTGKRITGLFKTIGDAFGGMFGDVTKGNTVERTLNGILNVVEPLVKALAGFGTGMFKGLMAGLKPLLDTMNDMNPAQNVEGFARLGEMAGKATAILVTGFAAASSAVLIFADAAGRMWNIGSVVYKLFTDVYSTMIALGIGIVDGLWTGITRGWGAMLEKFKALVTLLPKGVRDVLQIGSPSKVLDRLGDTAGQSFVRGVERSGMAAAVNDNMRVPSFRASAAWGGNTTTHNMGGITVNVTVNTPAGADSAGVGKEVADALEERLVEVFARSARSAGA
jgi:tape measure domain-containing protein